MQKTLTNLDCKEKSTIATNDDVYHAMRWCFNYPDFDASLSAWMQQSAAFFVLLSQLRAMRGLLANPQVCSAKLVNHSPGAIQFKRERTVTAMQQMLSQMCCAQTPAVAPSSGVHVRALAQQLIDLSGTDALPSGMVEPNVPSINFESAGEQPLGTSHGLVIPTSNTLPTLEQQPQTSPLTNQRMDMILSLQNQMQQRQQEAAT